MAEVARVLPRFEASARAIYAAKRNTVKHNRGTDVFDAGSIRFGLGRFTTKEEIDYVVGDVVQIGDATGKVEAINIRVRKAAAPVHLHGPGDA